MVLAHTVILENKPSENNKFQARVGSNKQWKFSDILQVDANKKLDQLDWGETTANTDERPPFKIPLSERCAEKLKLKVISLPDFLKSE